MSGTFLRYYEKTVKQAAVRLPASPYDIEKGEGKCLESQAFLLDEFMIQGPETKVNDPGESFTICLQAFKKWPSLFIKRSKNIRKAYID